MTAFSTNFISYDDRKLDRLGRKFGLSAATMTRVRYTAANRTAKTLKSDISKEVRKEVTLSKESTDKRLSIPKDASKASPNAVVRVSRKSSPALISFRAGYKPRDTRGRKRNAGQGVMVKVRRNKGAEQHRHAFIARGKGLLADGSANYQIFEREPPGSKFALRVLRGPSVLRVYRQHPGIEERVMANAGVAFRKNLASQISRWLAKKGGGR